MHRLRHRVQHAQKGYRGFESISLRHTVWIVERRGCIPLKISGNRAQFCDPNPETGLEKVSRSTS